jgi:hypothetical protein
VACRVIRDTHGTLYRIPEAVHVKTPGKQMLPGCASVDVWWDRDIGPKRNDETLLIRQDNAGKPDVIELTLGQVYDLIHALGWAVMRP